MYSYYRPLKSVCWCLPYQRLSLYKFIAGNDFQGRDNSGSSLLSGSCQRNKKEHKFADRITGWISFRRCVPDLRAEQSRFTLSLRATEVGDDGSAVSSPLFAIRHVRGARGTCDASVCVGSVNRIFARTVDLCFSFGCHSQVVISILAWNCFNSFVQFKKISAFSWKLQLCDPWFYMQISNKCCWFVNCYNRRNGICHHPFNDNEILNLPVNYVRSF